MELKFLNAVDDEKSIECMRNRVILYKLSDISYKHNVLPVLLVS